MCGVGVRVAAAVRGEHLDGDLRRHRALHDGLFVHRLFLHHRLAFRAEDGFAFVVLLLDGDFVGLDELGLRVRLEVLNHALRHEEDREYEADGQQQVVGDAHEVHPEVAERLRRMPREGAHERRRDADADGAGGEVVDGQRDHLREIRHRGFARVALPVGVGGEADGGVEREVRTERAKSLWIEREEVLQPQDGVGEQAAHQAEEQHGERVLLPVVLAVRLHAHEPVGKPFQRFHHGVEPGLPIGIEHADEIQAKRLGDERERADEQGQLQPVRSLHIESSEFFRTQHGDQQVAKQRQRNETNDDVFHRDFQSFPQKRA